MLHQRMITGLIAGVIFLFFLICGTWAYTALLVLSALIGYFEFVRLNGQSWTRPDILLSFVGVFLFTVPDEFTLGFQKPSFLLVLWLLMLSLLTVTVLSKNRIQLEQVSVLLLGTVYIGVGFHSMIQIRNINHGFFWSLLLFFCVWASDIGAYFVGKAIGKTKLWPAISPNKTIEGAIGGILSSVLIALFLTYLQPNLLSLDKAFGIGIIAAVIGQLGDLIQSAYKRFRQVKDAGCLFPGHGGILDRMDSWLIVFPFIYLLDLLPG